MFNFQQPFVNSITDQIDFDKLGKINIKDMKTLPLLNFKYKGKEIMRDNKEDVAILSKYLKVRYDVYESKHIGIGKYK